MGIGRRQLVGRVNGQVVHPSKISTYSIGNCSRKPPKVHSSGWGWPILGGGGGGGTWANVRGATLLGRAWIMLQGQLLGSKRVKIRPFRILPCPA
jgi:hypothetical protein